MSRTKRPSKRQIEAYKYLYILDIGSHEEAAMLMGCHRSNVTRLIGRLKRSNPDLFNLSYAKYISWDDMHELYIKQKF